MKVNGKELNEKEVDGKVVSIIKSPKFEKFPLLAISIGGDGFKKFGYTRGKNYGILSFFGIYITFRLPYKKYEVWVQGVEDGFKVTNKTIASLLKHINTQNVIIANLLSDKELFEDDDDNDDNKGFNQLWN